MLCVFLYYIVRIMLVSATCIYCTVYGILCVSTLAVVSSYKESRNNKPIYGYTCCLTLLASFFHLSFKNMYVTQSEP